MSSSLTAAHSSLLPDAPITIDTVEYDFEQFALTHGIPDTLDPLPYRRTGSVFAADDYFSNNNNDNNQENNNNLDSYNNNATTTTAEPVLTSAKHDPRLRTVVCRHWLRDLCMKGAACEFLHQYDLSKMPLCRHGERCKIKDCPFRHISETDRLECAFYKSGFCIHGPFCRYKHQARPREDLPLVADFTLGLSQMQAGAKDGEGKLLNTRRPAPKPNEFYKISLCKHFAAGDCPFGTSCHFAHGEAELRSFPRGHNKTTDGESDILTDTMFHSSNPDTTTTTTTTVLDYFQGGAAGGGKPTPILEPEQAHFFLIASASQHDLCQSTVRGEWFLQRKHAEQINHRLQPSNTTTTSNHQVMLFFTVSDSRHIQGAALVTEACQYLSKLDQPGKDSFCYRVGVEWYRTTEFPISIALEVAPDLILPTASTQFCQDMSSSTGASLMKALWNSPLVTLYESWSDDAEPPENILADFREPAPDEVAWPTMPGPGFIFGCSSDTMDECLGRGIFGLPAHMKPVAAQIQPGATVFLFNVTDRLLFGIFEALTPATMNIEPTAFSKNPKATQSPFPVQIRVRISLECPPLEDNDPVFGVILRHRGTGRIGPLTHAQTEAIATLLASQCGALQYMMDYRQAKQQKTGSTAVVVRDPPIALPPRKIVARPPPPPPQFMVPSYCSTNRVKFHYPTIGRTTRSTNYSCQNYTHCKYTIIYYTTLKEAVNEDSPEQVSTRHSKMM